MKVTRVDFFEEIPDDYTGIIIYPNETKYWLKEGECHREDGPAVEERYHREWYLNDTKIFCSCDLGSIFCVKNKVVLSKETHELYPKIQKWKVLSKNEIYDVLIFPGLEGYILE
jgi:hypothetical protein